MSNTHLISPVTDKRARNRLLFLVAFGWLVLGATNVPNKQQQISGIAAEQSNVARTPVQETIDQQKKSALPYKPVCEQPDDQAEYILCASIAQAAAADRANQISSASLRTNEVGIALLLLTLFATAWAAYAASRATKVAERLIDGSERPYLIVEFLEANFSGADAPQDFLVVKYRVRNVGGSVAIIDLYRDCLGFNSNLPEDWRRHLGGSNIAFIEKDGFMDTCVDSSVTQSELRCRLGTETLVWNINFSYTDRFQRRRNFHFEQYAGAFPFQQFRSNYAPEIIEVPFDHYKWHRRRNTFRLWWWRAKEWLIGVPKRQPNPSPEGHPSHNQDRAPGWIRWVRAGFRRPPARW